MSARWRDKKGEPGFVFHAWMRTVDELEDQIEELVAALKEARGYLELYAGTGFDFSAIDAALQKSTGDPR